MNVQVACWVDRSGDLYVQVDYRTLAFPTVDDAAGFVASYVRSRLATYVADVAALDDELARWHGTASEAEDVPF
jgi:hypothetical protein